MTHKAFVFFVFCVIAHAADSKELTELRRRLADSEAARRSLDSSIGELRQQVTAQGSSQIRAREKLARTVVVDHNTIAQKLADNAAVAKLAAEKTATLVQAAADNAEDASAAAALAAKSSASLTSPLWVTFGLAAVGAFGALFGWLRVREVRKSQEEARKSQEEMRANIDKVHEAQIETKNLALKIELSINSRMDELLKVTKSDSEAKGVASEKLRQATEATRAGSSEPTG